MKVPTQMFHLAASAVLLFASVPAVKAQITAAPASLAFVYQVGSVNPAAQTVNVSGPAGLAVTVTKQAPAIGPSEWLYFSSSSSLPFTMTVFVLANSSFPPGNYSATITVAATNGSGTPLVIPVSFKVSTNPLLTSTPGSLTFQYALNGSQPPQQTVSLGSSGTTQLNFTATPSTTSGGSWLSVTPPATGNTPAVLTIGATVDNTFPVGTYNGKVSLTSTSQGNPTLDIPVTLIVTPETTLTTAPSALTFTFQTGTSAPLPHVLTVGSTGASVGVNVTTEATGGGAGPAWLSVAPTSGPTPLNLSVTANPSGLALGDYKANIKLTAPGASNSPQTVPVTLKVTDKPVVQLSSSSLSFQHQIGGSAPAGELVLVTNTGAGLPVNLTVDAAGGTWLSATPSSSTSPAALLVTADPGTLVAGEYNGTIGIAVPGAAVPQLTLPVTLTVSANPLMRISRNRLGFVHQTGQTPPAAKPISVTSTGAAIPFTVTTNVASGGSWLGVSAASGTTPLDLPITVNPTGLSPGLYSGTVTITPTGQGGAARTVEVTLQVSDNVLLNVPDTPLRFSFGTGGQQPPDQTLSVTATSGTLSYTVSPTTMSGGAWLIAGPLSGSTGQPVTVGINTNFSGGTFTGLLAINSSAGNSPIYVPVLYNGNNTSTLQVAPNSLKFTQTSGTNPPAAQTLTVSSTGTRLDFTTTVQTLNGGDWLASTPSGGLTPGTLTVSIKTNTLTAGTYTGTITVTSSALGAQQVIPITLEVPPAVNQLVAAPASLSFAYTIGGTAPPSQQLNLKSSSMVNYTLTTSTATGGQWLAVTPPNGATESNVTVSVSITGLAAGVYTGTVNVNAPTANNSPLQVPVTLTVTAPPAGSLTTFQNGASFLPTSAAAGLIVTLRGTGLGPATGVSFQLTPQGTVPTTVGDTRVLFDGVPAPVLFTSATQINAVVPYEIAGRFSSKVEVEYKGVKTNQLDIRVVDSAPGIFSLTATGTGQGAILNQNGTVNSSSNPAARGEVIVIYATGEGQTTPAGVNGSVPRTVGELKKPLGTVKVRIGGVEVTPLYAGSAPFFVAGVMQVNAAIPEGISTGPNVPVELIVGAGTSAAQSITVAVR
ncbi:MAG TPA: hypothetical protein VFB63_08090 [Bryobacteraceae bacterium]|nr:hypothetical protein [Bryobacteraceae bacterium]